MCEDRNSAERDTSSGSWGGEASSNKKWNGEGEGCVSVGRGHWRVMVAPWGGLLRRACGGSDEGVMEASLKDGIDEQNKGDEATHRGWFEETGFGAQAASEYKWQQLEAHGHCLQKQG